MNNPMKTIRVEKITLNIGAGKNQERLDKGIKLIKNITGVAPVKTFTNKRIPTWGLRPGLPIGCKLTLRKKKAIELLTRLLQAKENRLSPDQFDNEGNVAFGIPEYIDIPGVEYDPSIGITGLEVCLTLERPGFRIKKRSSKKRSIPRPHRIGREEAIEFMKKAFNVKVGEEE
ncbi:50S ribosomal protein L5 [Candidatus Woesearchaeota archaeon]|nr:50S ribosomal protein L5 [Candidatus Woesearchaeota archaeon]